MLLNGFGFSGYRSFGDELVKIGPLKKINLIIGQNNVGKSNIINFLYSQYPHYVARVKGDNSYGPEQKVSFNYIDYPYNTKGSYKISFPIFKDEIDAYVFQILSKKNPEIPPNPRRLDWLKRIISSPLFC